MAESLITAGMVFETRDGASITTKDMLESFGPKRLFDYTCGFINAALAIIEHDIKPNETLFLVKPDN
ncbi:hypothetical protein D3C79_1108140 [compost metagenome]